MNRGCVLLISSRGKTFARVQFTHQMSSYTLSVSSYFYFMQLEAKCFQTSLICHKVFRSPESNVFPGLRLDSILHRCKLNVTTLKESKSLLSAR